MQPSQIELFNTAPLESDGEKEVMIQAFDKVRKLFELREWLMDGRGSYPYDDDRYKDEIRILYEEFDQVQKDTWKNIKTKSFEYRKKVIDSFMGFGNAIKLIGKEGGQVVREATADRVEDLGTYVDGYKLDMLSIWVNLESRTDFDDLIKLLQIAQQMFDIRGGKIKTNQAYYDVDHNLDIVPSASAGEPVTVTITKENHSTHDPVKELHNRIKKDH